MALRRDAAIWLNVIPLLLLKCLFGVSRAAADKLCENWVVGGTEEASIGARPRHFAHASGAERPRQNEISRKLGYVVQFGTLLNIVDNRSDERPVSRVARAELHRELDIGNASRGERHAVDWV